MATSHDRFSKLSSDIYCRWLEREHQRCSEMLFQLNLKQSSSDSPGKNYSALRNALMLSMAAISKKITQAKNGNYSLDPFHELKQINQDLKKLHQIKNFQEREQRFTRDELSKIKLLSQRRKYLVAVQRGEKKALPKIADDEKASAKERKGLLKVVFDIGKKFVDLIDDIWAAMRSLLPHNLVEAVGPILIGATGFVIHLGEGYEGAKLAYAAYKNEKIGQRKTRILTSSLTFAIAGAGIGMSLALLASAAGAAVASAPLLPVLIPAALTAIYGLSLWRQSYIFDRAKEEEKKAHNAYQKELLKIQPLIESIDKLNVEKNNLIESMSSLLTTLKQKIELSDGEKEIHKKYLDDLNKLNKKQSELDHQCGFRQGYITGLKRIYEENQGKRLQAERDVAFTTLEVAGSAMVLLGIILGTVAVVGTSIGTFGIAPLALIITGVVTAAGSKIFEAQDEKNHHVYTTKIRNFFVNTWEKMVSSEKNLEVKPAPTPVVNLPTPTHKDNLTVARSVLPTPPKAAEEPHLRPKPASSTHVLVRRLSTSALPVAASAVEVRGENPTLSPARNTPPR